MDTVQVLCVKPVEVTRSGVNVEVVSMFLDEAGKPYLVEVYDAEGHKARLVRDGGQYWMVTPSGVTRVGEDAIPQCDSGTRIEIGDKTRISEAECSGSVIVYATVQDLMDSLRTGRLRNATIYYADLDVVLVLNGERLDVRRRLSKPYKLVLVGCLG